MPSPAIPADRLRQANDQPIRSEGDYVLYWMTAARRTRYNFALDHAVVRARELGLPLVIMEALRCDYRWASDRHHRFVLDGMHDNAEACRKAKVLYYPYVEPAVGAGKALLQTLAERAAIVVADDYPCFFLPQMVAAAASSLPMRMESVDSNGLLPYRTPGRAFTRAYDFRRYLQKSLRPHLAKQPREDGLAKHGLPAPPKLAAEVHQRWPAASPELLEGTQGLAAFPINHQVAPTAQAGGAKQAERRLHDFVSDHLAGYAEHRNDDGATSELSPYLHFGHLGAHEIFAAIAKQEQWNPAKLADITSGKRGVWWGMSEAAEGYLDQLVTWRELGFGFCHFRPDFERYESLPDWARATLAEHAADARPHLYSLASFDQAQTHDELWNAAQNQLRSEGRIHNYLRMLWGKKILHWSAGPEVALDIMIELNNRYALDGRDPNSYSGIFWTLGRFDRAWGPEREIFGKIRYMTSANTRRKLRLSDYLAKWREPSPGLFDA